MESVGQPETTDARGCQARNHEPDGYAAGEFVRTQYNNTKKKPSRIIRRNHAGERHHRNDHQRHHERERPARPGLEQVREPPGPAFITSCLHCSFTTSRRGFLFADVKFRLLQNSNTSRFFHGLKKHVRHNQIAGAGFGYSAKIFNRDHDVLVMEATIG